jgi:hypothetical protein
MTAAQVLAPLDAARHAVLSALGPLGRRLLRERGLRVAISGTAIVGLALALTATAPLWLLAVGPLLLGVPHLVADVRYLVIRPGNHRRRALSVLCGIPLLAVSAGAAPHVGLLAVAGAFLAARAPWPRRAIGAVLAATLAVVVWRTAAVSTLVLAHLHNFLAVAIWWTWRPHGDGWRLLPLASFAAGIALIASGLMDPLLVGTLEPSFAHPDLNVDTYVAWFAGGLEGAWGLRLVLLFAFAQSVHYGIWLRLIPEEDRARETPRTFASSYRVLRADFGGWGLAAVLLLALGIAVWGIFDLAAASFGYFRLALFHGYLEFAALALRCAEGRRP